MPVRACSNANHSAFHSRSVQVTAGWLAPVLFLLLVIPARAEEKPLEFHLAFTRAVSDKPFTGRVYVMLFKNPSKDLRSGPSWFNTEPFFALDVKNWKPGEKVVLGSNALAFPTPLSRIKPDTYTIQAVMDFDRGAISFSTAPGNGYTIARQPLDPARTGPVNLILDQVVTRRPFPETDRVKLVDIPSKLLTAFYGRETHLRAGVVLPVSFAKDPKRLYPIVYEIPGFGGNHQMASGRVDFTNLAGEEFIWVVLDPSCRNGHHVFADSANNGPVGQALIEELIPYIERKYRALGKPSSRLLTGHSSGGWSSLWLQVSYPDFFGGVWSTAPDPVDFRDFQRINLYRPGVNMFKDEAGKDRPIARRDNTAVLFYKPFSDLEVVMGHGGQLASFEAVFSERGKDGQPRKLWDRRSGSVDAEVAHSWEKYDIRLILERNWKTLGPKLKGKIHVYMGDLDTFYLEGATILLKDSLKKLGSDAVIELFPGKNHGTLLSKELRARIAREMAAQVKGTREEQ